MTPEQDDIYTWNTEKLWNITQVLMEEETDNGTLLKLIYQKEINQIKQGIKVRIPIQYIIKGWYEEYPNTKKIKIRGHGIWEMKHFLDEIDERNTLMRTIIRENEQERGITVARTENG